MSLRAIARYFYPPARRQPYIPRQLITDYDIRQASELERLAMRARRARSPEAARAVFKTYQVSSTRDLRQIPKFRPSRPTPMQRLVVLLARVLGYSTYNPFRRDHRMQVRYQYKRRR